MRGPLDAPELGGFVAALDPVGRLAKESRGFVWQLNNRHRPETVPDGDGFMVVNVSVWTSYEALHAFTYRSAHGAFVRRRAEWFRPTPQPSTALWWVPAGHRPTVDEALRHLALLRRYGPTPRAFGLRRRFTPDGRPVLR
jgi:hypothetical protein